MEHLFLPAGSKVDVVEYAGNSDYIGIPFLEYPRVQHKEIYLKAGLGSRGLVYARTHEVAEDEGPWFTTWLLCSLLQEVLKFVPEKLGIEPSYDHGAFVKSRSVTSDTSANVSSGDNTHGEVEVFCTTELALLLKDWRAQVKARQEQAKETYAHLYTCLLTTHTVLSWSNMKNVLPSPITKEIAMIGSILATAIESAFEDATWYEDVPHPPQAWVTHGWGELDISLGMSNGWCLSEMYYTWLPL